MRPRFAFALVVIARLAFLPIAACDYDLDGIPRNNQPVEGQSPVRRDGGSDGGGHAAADDDAGSDDEDGGVAAPPPCTGDAPRCNGALIEACEDGVWIAQQDCKRAGCNPITFECNGCEAELNEDGVLACAAARAAQSGSAIAELDTGAGSDALQGSCGGGGSPDQVVEWIAPETDYWQLDTLGSSYDTVLYARNCACYGAELACSDDAGGSESAIVLHAERGQRFAIVLDGHAGDQGRALLNAERVSCPSFDLDPASLPSTFKDRGGDGSEAFRYVAKAAGLYSFHVTVPDGAPVSACLRAGARCEDPLLGCNDSADEYGAEVIRQLKAGQVVSLVITLGGEFTGETELALDVHMLQGASCAPTMIDGLDGTGAVMQSASLNSLTPSCAQAGDKRVENDGQLVGYSETLFTFATTPGESCDLYVNSARPTTLYALRDDCAGPELACAKSETIDTGNPAFTQRALIELPASSEPRQYLIAIENRDSIAGPAPFEYGIGCIK